MEGDPLGDEQQQGEERQVRPDDREGAPLRGPGGRRLAHRRQVGPGGAVQVGDPAVEQVRRHHQVAAAAGGVVERGAVGLEGEFRAPPARLHLLALGVEDGPGAHPHPHRAQAGAAHLHIGEPTERPGEEDREVRLQGQVRPLQGEGEGQRPPGALAGGEEAQPGIAEQLRPASAGRHPAGGERQRFRFEGADLPGQGVFEVEPGEQRMLLRPRRHRQHHRRGLAGSVRGFLPGLFRAARDSVLRTVAGGRRRRLVAGLRALPDPGRQPVRFPGTGEEQRRARQRLRGRTVEDDQIHFVERRLRQIPGRHGFQTDARVEPERRLPVGVVRSRQQHPQPVARGHIRVGGVVRGEAVPAGGRDHRAHRPGDEPGERHRLPGGGAGPDPQHPPQRGATGPVYLQRHHPGVRARRRFPRIAGVEHDLDIRLEAAGIAGQRTHIEGGDPGVRRRLEDRDPFHPGGDLRDRHPVPEEDHGGVARRPGLPGGRQQVGEIGEGVFRAEDRAQRLHRRERLPAGDERPPAPPAAGVQDQELAGLPAGGDPAARLPRRPFPSADPVSAGGGHRRGGVQHQDQPAHLPVAERRPGEGERHRERREQRDQQRDQPSPEVLAPAPFVEHPPPDEVRRHPHRLRLRAHPVEQPDEAGGQQQAGGEHQRRHPEGHRISAEIRREPEPESGGSRNAKRSREQVGELR